VRDAPRKRAQDYRREEWVAHGIEAAEVDAIARRHTRGHFCVCAVRTMDEPDGPIRAAYKAAGYRLGSTQSFMVHRLAKIPNVPQPLPVERVQTEEMADRLAKAAGRRQILPAHLVPNAPERQYVALDNAAPVGWAASIAVGDSTDDSAGKATWVQSMYVLPAYRRRGIGKSILAKMLRDDRAHGSAASYLLASHAGALLYPNVGYEAIGELLVYTPRRTARP
jgi:GNAT superfamily N-acetyltransferase